MSTKQFSLSIGVIVVVLIAAVSYLLTTKTTQAPSQAQGQDEQIKFNGKQEVFVSTPYNFEFEYPEELEAYSVEYGPTDFDKRGLTVHIGSDQYINRIKHPGAVADDEPAYFLVSAFEPDKPVQPGQTDCSQAMTPENNAHIEKIQLDGNIVTQCQFTSMFGANAMMISFTRDGKTYFSLYSDLYTGLTKQTIDRMLQSFKFEP